MANYHYYQQVGGEEAWKALPLSSFAKFLEENKPAFTTVLAVSKLVEGLDADERDKLSYTGPLYLDWDAQDISVVLPKVNALLDKLEAMKLDLSMVRFYATGGKGFHAEIPPGCFMEKQPKGGVPHLPVVYREIALDLYVDTLDMRVYSQGRGRMWRTANVLRTNGHYKVPVTAEEIRGMTEQTYALLTSEPREATPLTKPELCIDLAITYARAAQKVEDKLKARGKRKKDPQAKIKAGLPSVMMMMDGLGIKPGAGFHEIALQVTISATTANLTEDKMIEACQGLINEHQSDSNRYNSPKKREEELRRLYRYVDDNPCYEFSVGAVKVLLDHEAPDLDGLHVTTEEVKQGIVEAKAAAADESLTPDEYADVTGGVTLSKFGVYADTEFGKKRICAISFEAIHLLMSTETGQLSAYEAEVLVNGRGTGRQTMELDTFASLQMFNRFAARMGHAMQGTETHVRGLMMRFVELAKKKGRVMYIAKREGLDVVNIPNHEDTSLREPFMVWADGRGIMLDPRIDATKLDMSFQGFPDPRGLFKVDLADAPKLVDWFKVPGNKEALRETLTNLFTCQKPEVLAKMLGWYVASIYRMLFHRAYGKFPILHVNGPAGSGKCLGEGTPVLMADGRRLPVEAVQQGDFLMGPDGLPRKVLSVCSGVDQLYRVTPVKGDPYVVNSTHILSLRKSERDGCVLSDGTHVPAAADVVNVNVETFLQSSPSARKSLKGWRSGAVEFTGRKQHLPLDPYWLGCWLGDGKATDPILYKPECNMTRWWVQHAVQHGCEVVEYAVESGCPGWSIVNAVDGACGKGNRQKNVFKEKLRGLQLLNNKHVPPQYLTASVADRLSLIAGLLDSDGHFSNNTFDWLSKSRDMAQDFAFLCRSVGLACYVSECRKGIKSLGFEGTYWRCCVSGDLERIPCLDKRAEKRKQVKRHLVHGITVEPAGRGAYFGFELDGDKLFLLGDFTVTHNTEMNKALMGLFYYNQEPKLLTPGSSLFAVKQNMAGSASVPLLLDEYKPQDMSIDMHSNYRLMIRDAYNCRDVAKGGGTRESDDYRKLHETQLSAPLVVIAEAAEEEAAVAERVVLVTIVKPPSSVSTTWAMRFHTWSRNTKHLTVLGQWLVAQAINTCSIDALRAEFDPIYEEARNKFMLTAADLERDLKPEELHDKQNAKERSVYNFSVARFGLSKLRGLVKSLYGAEFEKYFVEMDAGIYTRMNDLQSATQAEWAKVLSVMATMTHHIEPDAPNALRVGHDYAFSSMGGRPCVEIAMRNAYLKYRAYCRQSALKPLFQGDQSFLHAIKDCPALVESGIGRELHVPGVYTFDTDELARLNVDHFKD